MSLTQLLLAILDISPSCHLTLRALGNLFPFAQNVLSSLLLLLQGQTPVYLSVDSPFPALETSWHFMDSFRTCPCCYFLCLSISPGAWALLVGSPCSLFLSKFCISLRTSAFAMMAQQSEDVRIWGNEMDMGMGTCGYKSFKK